MSVNRAPGRTRDGGSGFATISADGCYVAFLSQAADLVPGLAVNGGLQVYVRDLVAGTTKLASINQAGTNGGDGVDTTIPLIMPADGRYVAFASDSDDLVAGDTNGRPTCSYAIS